MDLPSFLWLWRFAAWSMGFSLFFYGCLALTSLGMIRDRHSNVPTGLWRWLHIISGLTLVTLVLALFMIGIVGTLGEYGDLGHSPHALFGTTVVVLTLLSAGAALQIKTGKGWAKPTHVTLNGLLGLALMGVLWTGWTVVQKYLP